LLYNRKVIIYINHNKIKKYTEINDLTVIYCENSFSPVINTLFNYCGVKKDNENNKYIIGLLLNNSNVNIKDNKRFTNFPYTCVFGMNNSNISAYKALFSENGIFSDKHGAGVRVSRSNLEAEKSLANDCGEYGYWIQHASTAKVNGSIAKGAGHHNLVISQGSTGTARNCTFTDSPDNAVVVTTNSSLDLSGSDCSRCGNNNIVAQLNSSVYFADGISNDSGISGLN